MHDNTGRPLKVGDLVLVPMIVEYCNPTPDYCNVTLRSVQGRKPDAYKEVMTTNANIIFRSNPDDIMPGLEVMFEGYEAMLPQPVAAEEVVEQEE